MSGALYQLYSGEYDINADWDEAQGEVSQKISAMLEKLKAEYGLEFVDRLSNLYADRAELSNFQNFQEGFRLGASLMLEVFRRA